VSAIFFSFACSLAEFLLLVLSFSVLGLDHSRSAREERVSALLPENSFCPLCS
jgi:hypothetical protein